MTSQEFVIWLKGFTEGVHEFNITPKQWDLLKEKLSQVIGDDNKFVETPKFPFGTPNGTDHDLVQRYPYGAPIPCGEVSIPSIWTSTSGSSATYTVTSGSSYSGVTTYLYPNGTTVTYTGGTNDNWNIKNKDLLHD